MKHIISYLKKSTFSLGVAFVVFFGFAPATYAAVLYFEPSQFNIGIGDEFRVDVFVDTEGELINAIETIVVFSDANLTLVDIDSTNSIIDFWIEQGSESEGIVSLSGVKTNGFRSVIDPFGTNVTFAKVATLVFKGKAVGSSLLVLTGSRVLLNDGFGTETTTTNGESAAVRVFTSVASGGSGEPQGGADTVKPEPFEVYVEKTPLLPGGGYYVFFQATDNESGIEYYEIKEGNGDWQRAESPYLLEARRSPLVIYVKAVDKEGNERIVTKSLEYKTKTDIRSFSIVVLLGSLFLVFMLIRRKRQRNRTE